MPNETAENRCSSDICQVAGLRPVDLPDSLSGDPRLQGQFCYALMPGLLDALERACVEKGLDPNLVAFERSLSEAAWNIPSCVGFANGQPILDLYLRPPEPLVLSNPLAADYFRDCVAAGYQCDLLALQSADQQVGELRDDQQAYLGWLFSDPQFLSELDELAAQHSALFMNGSLPPAAMTTIATSWSTETASTDASELGPAVAEFCRRWRLARIVGPRTVQPISIQFPVMEPRPLTPSAQTNGSLLFVPDISPLPDRDVLRQMIGTVRDQTARLSEHLKGWFDEIAVDNQGSKSLQVFARVYKICHWRHVIESRLTRSVSRVLGRTDQAIAEFLDLTEDEMRHACRKIRARSSVDD